ncbi:thyrotropin-releasing hormone receptor [Patella vulgata]|uniref:thyrotropin-releasing hormone receptor n=1 Tax=Patella vulgata TaxID=6465 RepID=UPI0024A9B189|nr:thyrotropin-releasing hormone receptor [Patella vulgata]
MHTPTNCYLLSLAVADVIVLLSATLPSIPEPFFQIDEWRFGRVLCSLLIFLQNVGVDASSASITAFTVERYFAICKPIRAQTMCTVNRAKKIIVGIWILTILYCSPWLGLTDLKQITQIDGNVIEKCQFRLARPSYLTYFMTDLVIFYIIPFFISAVLYCLIGRILFSNNLTKNISQFQNCDKDECNICYSSLNIEKQVVRMLFVVVLVFATLWMPYRVMVVYNSFAKHKFMDLWFLLFSRSMIYINSAINPILYNAMSVKFRRAFKNHLCCEPSCQKPETCRQAAIVRSSAHERSFGGRNWSVN